MSYQRPKPNFIQNILANLTGANTLQAEKSRLEAFLAAVPGDYCGWSSDGAAAYSEGFCKLLELEKVGSIVDIQNRLCASDSAALEGVFNRLRESGIPFQITTKNLNEDKIFRISGSRGQSLNGRDFFHILWIEDITRLSDTERRTKLELEQKEQKLSLLQVSLESFPWPLWKRDTTQQIIWCNEAYAALIGDTPEAIIAGQKEIPPASRKKKRADEPVKPSGRELARLSLEERATQQTEIHVIVGGKRLLMRIFESPVSDGHCTVGFAEDITDQENLENDLRRYQATNEELLEQLRTAIGIFGQDQRLEFYNSAFSELWGIEDQWLNGKPKLGDLMEKLRENRRLPEQADFRRFKQSWLDMFTSLINPHEDMLYLPDDSALRMLVVPQSAGGLMMTFEDVTSRLELESSYNTLIAVQKETLDNLAEGVAVYAGNGRLKLWNPSFARLWNLNPEDLAGEPHINTLIEKKKPFFAEHEWAHRRDELITTGLDRVLHEGRLKRTNDTLVDFSTVPLPDGGVMITYTDATDTVRVENALRDKNAALETAEKLKIDFLANVSYQLRTPLNAIMGFNDILDQEYFGPLNTRQKEYTHDIGSASERLLTLINDILDLSTIEAGYMSLEVEQAGVLELLENTVDLASEWARKSKIEISLACPKSIGKVPMDTRRIKQAIMNIIHNSIAFTPSGGKITVAAKKRKDGIEIMITDTGIGIAGEHHMRVFEPFERAQKGNGQDAKNPDSAGKNSKSGAGLGLSLVKNIMALHGGSVHLSSAQNKGTSVTLFLPFETQSAAGEEALNHVIASGV